MARLSTGSPDRSEGSAKLSLFADVICPDDRIMRHGRPTTIGILADDFSSTADGAAPFVMRGMPAAIGRLRRPKLDYPLIAADSRARSLSAPEAAERAAIAGGRPLLLAMKAGGFGDDETLRRAAARLRRELP